MTTPNDAPRPTSELVEWRCFHCGETFTDKDAAADHFGWSEYGSSACRVDGGLAHAYRVQENELRRSRKEDTDLHRSLWSLGAKAETDRREWGDKEYAKGVADGLAEAAASLQALEARNKELEGALFLCEAAYDAAPDQQAEAYLAARAALYPLEVTVVDGCRVHGDEPLSPDGVEAVRSVIKAAREKMSKAPTPTHEEER